MAKKVKPNPLTDIFAKTEKPGEDGRLPDPVRPRGIGLKTFQWKRLEEIAGETGTTAHNVAIWAVRDFLKRWAAGKIRTKTKKHLPD